MCGIVGVGFATERAQLLAIPNMSAQIRHRGPDDFGTWFDYDAGIGLGHQRLSIVDLSPSGHQPMTSTSGRYVITFNGEIYNHQEIKKNLTQSQFQGRSDTEVFLCAIETGGVEKALAESVGMFAFALWDKQEKALYLARDRFGEKPLYYGWINGAVVFASELKVFQFFPKFDRKISKNALDLYLRYGFISAPYSIYEGILKLSPGKYLKMQGSHKVEEKIYWSAKTVAQQGLKNRTTLSYQEATNELEKKLSETISLQMCADVPVGAFLSGGVDSSLITALMQKQSQKPIKTFSIGFHEKAFNEALHAQNVAAHLRTEHTELYITDVMCRDLLPSFSALYDEPFTDQSQLPTYLLAKMTHEKVKVSLSGDAGDELFGGYQRYLYADALWKKCQSLPVGVRKRFSKLAYEILRKMSTPKRYQNTVRKLIKYADLFSHATNRQDFYFAFTRSDANPWLANFSQEPDTVISNQSEWLDGAHFIEWMMYQDTASFLPDDILTKVDRTTMAVGLENRVPFLDHRIYEFAWQLPLEYKIHNGQGKRILRDILYRHVPKALVDRPKQGFGIPLSQWIRGPLSFWFEELLSQSHLLDEHWNVAHLKKKWRIVKETSNTQYDTTFWAVFIFQKWLEISKVME